MQVRAFLEVYQTVGSVPGMTIVPRTVSYGFGVWRINPEDRGECDVANLEYSSDDYTLMERGSMEKNSSVAVAITVPAYARLDIIVPALGFLVPFFVSGPQLLTGTLVNCLLFLYAWRIPRSRYFIMSAFPSIGAVANGVVFGTFTSYLLYFLPFIWIGNMVLIGVARSAGKRHGILLVGEAAVKKAVLLLSASLVFVAFRVVPPMFLVAMGLMQFATAVIGGLIALGITTRLWRK